jgi:hypothetical protein
MADWGQTTRGFQNINPITGGEADYFPAWTSRLLELFPFELGFIPTRVDYVRTLAVVADKKILKKRTFPSVSTLTMNGSQFQ